jgi:hypothetical protein
MREIAGHVVGYILLCILAILCVGLFLLFLMRVRNQFSNTFGPSRSSDHPDPPKQRGYQEEDSPRK